MAKTANKNGDNEPRSNQASGFKDWVVRHQVATFYFLVFGISWPCMIAVYSVSNENMAVQAICGLAMTFSPVLVAFMVVSIAKSRPRRDPSRYRWPVFGIGWVVSWAILILHTWQIREAPLNLSAIVPTAFVAILPGWLISCAYSPIPGVRALFGTLLRPRGRLVWYLVAFFIVPTIQIAGAGITAFFGGRVESVAGDLPLGQAAVMIGLSFFYGLLFAGGINEETGWRGFVLPRLQARYPVIVAVFIVWFFWALWHIPYDIGRGLPVESILFNRLVLNFVWAVFLAWLYNRTQGSLLTPVIFHPAMNAFGEALPRTDAATVLFLVLALVVIIRERMWRQLPAESRALEAG